MSGTGHLASVEQLMARGALVNHPSKAGVTGLLVSAQEGHAELVLLLLTKHGATIDHADMAGWTALHLSSLGGHTDVVTHLLGQRAHVSEDSLPS